MLSGFAIYMSFESVKSNYQFVMNRVSKLYPAYWVSLLITYGTVSIFSLPGREVTPLDVIINLTMLQDWISLFFNVTHVDGAYWTLSRFISFYLIVFMINKLNLRKQLHLVLLVWLLTIVVLKLVGDLPEILRLIFLENEGIFFMIGILFYMLKEDSRKLSTISILALCVVATLIFGGRTGLVFALLFSMLFVLFICNYLAFINCKSLIFLGSISYSLYLLHQNIGFIIIRELHKIELNYFLVIIIPATVSIIMATLVTYYIERPMVKFLRRRVV